MNRRIDNFDIASLVLLTGTAALTAALYAELPPRIPIHFDAHGVPNGWASREVGAWLMPAIGFAAWAVTRFSTFFVPRAWRERLAASPMSAASCVVASLMVAGQILTLFASTHSGEPLGRGIALGLGVMWLALGQIMPRLRRNPIIGIRTAWTLTSDENWLRTHRVAAYAFGGAGLLAILAGVTGGTAAAPFAFAAIIVSGAVPMVYSYLLARRLPPER